MSARGRASTGEEREDVDRVAIDDEACEHRSSWGGAVLELLERTRHYVPKVQANALHDLRASIANARSEHTALCDDLERRISSRLDILSWDATVEEEDRTVLSRGMVVYDEMVSDLLPKYSVCRKSTCRECPFQGNRAEFDAYVRANITEETLSNWSCADGFLPSPFLCRAVMLAARRVGVITKLPEDHRLTLTLGQAEQVLDLPNASKRLTNRLESLGLLRDGALIPEARKLTYDLEHVLEDILGPPMEEE